MAVTQAAARDVLHREEPGGVLFAEVGDSHAGGVVQSGGRPELALEAADVRVVERSEASILSAHGASSRRSVARYTTPNPAAPELGAQAMTPVKHFSDLEGLRHRRRRAYHHPSPSVTPSSLSRWRGPEGG
jgi:hypothetical protein